MKYDQAGSATPSGRGVEDGMQTGSGNLRPRPQTVSERSGMQTGSDIKLISIEKVKISQNSTKY